MAGALRRPPAWIAGTAAAVLLTVVIALPWVTVQTATQEAPEADSVQLATRFSAGRGSIEAASRAMGRLERAVLDLEGVDTVEAMVREDGGSLTVQLAEPADRPAGFRAGRVRDAVREAAREVQGLEILRPGEDQMGGGAGGGPGQTGLGGLLGGSPAEVVVSGPDSEQLQILAESIRTRLESMPQVDQAWMSARPGMDEIWVEPNRRAFEAFGLTLDQVLPFLRLAGREGERMQTGFVLPTGRELPLVVERRDARRPRGASGDLTRMRIQTESGVVPVMALASMRRMPPQSMIVHHNGRRELSVLYRLAGDVPATGPNRVAIEDQIAAAVRSVPRPRGFTLETPGQEEAGGWFPADPAAGRGAALPGARHDLRVAHPAGSGAVRVAADVARGDVGAGVRGHAARHDGDAGGVDALRLDGEPGDSPRRPHAATGARRRMERGRGGARGRCANGPGRC